MRYKKRNSMRPLSALAYVPGWLKSLSCRKKAIFLSNELAEL
jgi:hypothetical protein